jgi:hypothetical protein
MQEAQVVTLAGELGCDRARTTMGYPKDIERNKKNK